LLPYTALSFKFGAEVWRSRSVESFPLVTAS
jgi:hypothetical protein